MQLKIYINLNKELTLPINYSHILQGIIYSALSDDLRYQKLLHNVGLNGSNYKLFTFSSLCGKHSIYNKTITFSEKIFLEIRSVDSYFIFLLYEHFKSNGITFGSENFSVDLKLENKIIRDNCINVKMNSPICITKKAENDKVIFLSPQDKDFEEYINNNFYNKYMSYYNTVPFSNIEITNTAISHSDKVVTTLKGIYITGWKGNYILNGSPDYLTFLYNCGIGNKNSQGFGLFELID